MVAKAISWKKNPEIVKEELLKSLRESHTVEELELNIENIIDQRETMDIIKSYEEIVKTGNKKTRRFETRQG